MSGDNGKDIIGEKQPQTEPQTIEMRIVIEPGKAPVVHFPLLNDKLITYGFLKIAEKTLDAHYVQMQSKIIKPGGIMNFVRGRN